MPKLLIVVGIKLDYLLSSVLSTFLFSTVLSFWLLLLSLMFLSFLFLVLSAFFVLLVVVVVVVFQERSTAGTTDHQWASASTKPVRMSP